VPHPLTTLAKAPADAVKLLAEDIIPLVEPITVLYNRTGLIMLPYHDTSQGSTFYVGEVLVAEGRVQVTAQAMNGATSTTVVEGYAACLGHDLEQALALAILDAALRAGVAAEHIGAFLADHAANQAADDEKLLRAVEKTRAEMQTF
jgi:alpha-D-ribose 1-methylphosphonate 5-triphosphate synthase subunit PhnG